MYKMKINIFVDQIYMKNKITFESHYCAKLFRIVKIAMILNGIVNNKINTYQSDLMQILNHYNYYIEKKQHYIFLKRTLLPRIEISNLSIIFLFLII